MLDNPAARDVLWPEVVVDFGHELITSVHTPIAWCRPVPHATHFPPSQHHTEQLCSSAVRLVIPLRGVIKGRSRNVSTSFHSIPASLPGLAGLIWPCRVGLKRQAKSLGMVGKIGLLVQPGADTLCSCNLLAHIIWLEVKPFAVGD